MDKMNRLVILNRRYCPGEAWTNRILAYAKGFAEKGNKVELYYIITDQKRTKPDVSIHGVTVINLWESDGPLAKKFKTVSFIKNLMRFPKMVKNGDRLLVYGGHVYQLLLALLIKRKANIFCEVTEHPQIFGHSFFSSFKNKLKIKLIKKLDGLFVISNSLKKYYITEGIPENKVHVINMFVDTKRFSDLQKTTNAKYIAYCGAVTYDKDGANILIESFAKFYTQHMDYKLYIIGKSVEPSVIEQLKDLARELGIKDNVVFTGAVDPNEIPQLLFNASILALARPNNLQAQNGFPTKLGEYFATGNPIVVSQVGEIPLFVKDMENGFLSEPNSDSFAKKLSWVADNYEQAKTIGLSGKKLSENEFNYKIQSAIALEYMFQ